MYRAKLKEAEIELYKKYPYACLNTTRQLQFRSREFMQLIEALDHVIVTFDPCWYNSDPDYLEGHFEYVIKGKLYTIASLIPKTKENK